MPTPHAEKLLRLAGGQVRAVLDVGAYRGDFSVPAALSNPEILFVGIEPIPALAAGLRDRTAQLPNYRVVECAIGTQRGEAALHVPSAGPYNFSSLQAFRTDRRTGRDVTLDAQIPVQVLRLSELVDELAPPGDLVVKIDAQGSDLDVLESVGAAMTRVRAGVIEAAVAARERVYEHSSTRSDVVRALRRSGFEVVGLHAEHPGAYEQDIVFARREALPWPRVWRLRYPLMVAAAWVAAAPIRLRDELGLRTRRLRQARDRHTGER